MGWKDAPIIDENEEDKEPTWMKSPIIVEEQKQKQQPSYIGGLGDYFTKGIPETGQQFNKRVVDKAQRIVAPTELGSLAKQGTGSTGFLGDLVEGVAGTPERVGRVGGFIGGVLGETASAGLGIVGKGINALSGGKIGQTLEPLAEKATDAIAGNKTVQDIAKWYDKLSDAEKANLGSTIDLTELIGLKAPGVASKVGDITEGAGKKVLRSGMKIKDTTAKLAGRNVDEGVEQIVDDIVKFNLTSKTGGYKGVANKAQDAIDNRMKFVTTKLDEFAKANPNTKVDVSKILDDLATDIKTGKVESIFTGEDQVAEFVKAIDKSLELRKLNGDQLVSDLPKVNTAIRKGLNLFSKGKFGINDAPIKEEVGDLIYLKVLDKIGEYLPDVRNANSEVHNLINVKNAALEARKRVGNKNVIGLTDVIGLVGGAPALQAMGVPGSMSSLAPIVAGGIVAKKALSGGRGASGLIDLGKGIKGTVKATKPAIQATTLGTTNTALEDLINKSKQRRQQ